MRAEKSQTTTKSNSIQPTTTATTTTMTTTTTTVAKIMYSQIFVKIFTFFSCVFCGLWEKCKATAKLYMIVVVFILFLLFLPYMTSLYANEEAREIKRSECDRDIRARAVISITRGRCCNRLQSKCIWLMWPGVDKSCNNNNNSNYYKCVSVKCSCRSEIFVVVIVVAFALFNNNC